MLEVRLGPAPIPGARALRRMRREVGPSFVFNVVVPPAVAALETSPAAKAALAQTLEAAALLEARSIVVATPPDVRPTAQSRDRLAKLFAALPAAGVLLGWEPAGLWERDDVWATARAIGAYPILDATQEELPQGAVVYTRLRALGAAKVGPRAMDRLATALAGRREAMIVVADPRIATRIKRELGSALAERPASVPRSAIVRPSASPLRAEDEEQ